MVKNIKTIYLFYNNNFNQLGTHTSSWRLTVDIIKKINDELNINNLFCISKTGKVVFKFSKNEEYIENFMKNIKELFPNDNFKFYFSLRFGGSLYAFEEYPF